MASEKTRELYVPTEPYVEKSLKDKQHKCCSKYFLVWVFVALIIALTVGLCVEFLFPVNWGLYRTDDIDTVHVYNGAPINFMHSTTHEKLVKQAKDEKFSRNFLINPTHLCDTWDAPTTEAYQRNPEVKLLVLVPSATGHFAHRSAIRRTWGSVAEKPHGPMRLGFVLGTTPNTTEEALIRHESEVYGDIIQADFADTYRNLTTKSVLMLKWVSRQCAHAQYFLKTDDDTFVNLPILSRVLQKPSYDPAEKFIGGHIHRGSFPTRKPTEKYYVSEEDYPEEEYPPYAAGSAYVTTGPMAAQLFDASQRVTPFLPMEDIFITGICADDIGATLVHEPSFRYIRPEDSSWDSLSTLATVHSMTPDDMDVVWQQMNQAILEALNFSDSSSISDSSDFMGSLSLSDLFRWPEGRPLFDGLDFEDSISGISSDSMKSPETKSIFDIFNMLKNQVEKQMNGKELGPNPLGANLKQDDSGLLRFLSNQDNEEPSDLPTKQINKGSFLRSPDKEKQILDAINWPKFNDTNSFLALYFK